MERGGSRRRGQSEHVDARHALNRFQFGVQFGVQVRGEIIGPPHRRPHSCPRHTALLSTVTIEAARSPSTVRPDFSIFSICPPGRPSNRPSRRPPRRPSVRLSVRPSVRPVPSVRPSVRPPVHLYCRPVGFLRTSVADPAMPPSAREEKVVVVEFGVWRPVPACGPWPAFRGSSCAGSCRAPCARRCAPASGSGTGRALTGSCCGAGA